MCNFKKPRENFPKTFGNPVVVYLKDIDQCITFYDTSKSITLLKNVLKSCLFFLLLFSIYIKIQCISKYIYIQTNNQVPID